MRHPIAKAAAIMTGIVLLTAGAAAAVPMARHVVEQSRGIARIAGKSAGALRNRRVRKRTHRCQTPAYRHGAGRGRAWTPICASGHGCGVRHAGGLRRCQWTGKSPIGWHDVYGPRDAVARFVLYPTSTSAGVAHA